MVFSLISHYCPQHAVLKNFQFTSFFSYELDGSIQRYNLLIKRRVRPTRCNNYDLLIIHQLNMFRASLCPSSESARPYITAYGFQHLCAGWSLGKQGSRPCAHSALCAQCAHGLLPAHQVLKTICSNIRTKVPEYGHNYARNMLS